MARQPTPASPAAEAPATEATATEAAEAEVSAPEVSPPDAPAVESSADDAPQVPADEELVPEELEAGQGEVVASDEAAESPNADSPSADSLGGDSPGGAATAEPPGGGGRRRAPVLLGGAAVVLAAFAVVAGIQAHNLRGQQASHNGALTDPAATSQVRRQVTSAINTIFSYNYADTATTRAAAQRLLTGPAVKEYDSLFRLVEQEAPAQHLVLTTKVTNAGVELLVGDRARVLIFADQRDTRSTTTETSYAGAMFAVNAVRQGGRWKIDNIDTFTGGS
jgi:Mce-associated membrane protein